MTKVVSVVKSDLTIGHPRRQLRDLDMQEFIKHFGSGSLRKSQQLGFDIQEAYLQERAQVEFGSGFIIIPRSRVTYTDIKLVPCQALTELGWHAERMIHLRPFDSDKFVCKQFEVEYADGRMLEGAGILLQETSAAWVPTGHMVLSVVAARRNGTYDNAINPF